MLKEAIFRSLIIKAVASLELKGSDLHRQSSIPWFSSYSE